MAFDKPLSRHIASAAIAAVLGAGGATAINRPAPPPKVQQVVVERAALKHGWGELTPAEQAAAVRSIGEAAKGLGLEVFCGLAACHDLAEDIDEVLVSAGAESSVVAPIGEVGRGAAILPDNPQTRAIARAFDLATGGRLQLEVFPNVPAGSAAAIMIGRTPR
jgi:hypothetical protein